jgi:regulator of cell morphogenesis and NO signaling
MIDIQQTLGSIAATYPASTTVFLRRRLDFCCGGGRKLGDACQRLGLDPHKVVAEIQAEATRRPAESWNDRPLPALIDFILVRYHEPLRIDVPALLEAARRVERVHAAKPSCPKGLASHLEPMQRELEQHLAKEEQVLFPTIREGLTGGRISGPIRVMMQEHDDHGVNLQRVRDLTTDLVPPDEACTTWRALYAGLTKLETGLMEHIHLENNVIFPGALGG